MEIPETIVLAALRLELEVGQVIADQVEGRDCVFLGGLYHAERSIADRLRYMGAGIDLDPGHPSASTRGEHGRIALRGVPFRFDDALHMTYEGDLLGLLNPFALLCGLVSCAMIIMHGGTYLALKADQQVAGFPPASRSKL